MPSMTACKCSCGRSNVVDDRLQRLRDRMLRRAAEDRGDFRRHHASLMRATAASTVSSTTSSTSRQNA